MNDNLKDYIDIRVKLCALRLRQIRESNNLSLREMGKKVGYNKMSISYYEKGERTPTLEYLAAVAKAFHVSLEWLTGGEVNLNKIKLDKLFDQFDEQEQKELLHYAQYLLERKRCNGS